MKELTELKQAGEAPEWLTEESLKTLMGGYLLPGETPKGMWQRAAKASAMALKKPELEEKFFDLMWKNWLCLSTPVAANSGVDRGLNISCFGSYVPDSVAGIFDTVKEVAMLSKHGGGTSAFFGDVRGRGEKIKGNGKSDGVIPFNKILDSTVLGVSQGGVRRGAFASYLPVTHPDIHEFLEMRRPSGDLNRQCLNIHHGITITDDWMQKVVDGDKEARELWIKIMKTRFETGEPYLLFIDNVNNANPECYKANNLKVKASNLCDEIQLFSDEKHTFVCCLSSLNLARWDEWKDTDAAYLSTWFLDGVMQEFINKTEGKEGFERARAFAIKSRALGLGVLGFHTLLQEKMLDFEGLPAYLLNKQIFKKLQRETTRASEDLAKEYGEPEWCVGFGVRNTHRMALAPTVSNSLISGGVSAGIEPIIANAYANKSAKGTFLVQNKTLEKLLESKGQNTALVWSSIVNNEGSVQHLDCLTKEEKEVFKTAREINQFALVKLAADRQQFIDQGQSVNLFFPANVNPKYFSEVHIEAWKQGMKGLYYCRTTSALKADSGSREYKRESTECVMCEG